MNRVLKWTLIIFALGGGFAGVAMALAALFQANMASGDRLIYVLLFFMNLAGVGVGILLVEREEAGLMAAAVYFGLQTPYLASFPATFKFMTGMGAWVYLGPTQLRFEWRLGTVSLVTYMREPPPKALGVGLNLVGLVLLILALRAWFKHQDARRAALRAGAEYGGS